jgi:hypothetical protein
MPPTNAINNTHLLGRTESLHNRYGPKDLLLYQSAGSLHISDKGRRIVARILQIRHGDLEDLSPLVSADVDEVSDTGDAVFVNNGSHVDAPAQEGR